MAAFNVLFLGAGIVNFGGKAGPWNHSLRLEQKLGDRLNVVGIIDPAVQSAEQVLANKRSAGIPGYADTKVFENLQEAGKGLSRDKAPRLAVLGFHCAGRGSTRPDRDAEIQLIKMFPGVALFMEKPLSMDTFEEVTAVSDALKAAGTITSVGYMLRYVKAVRHMKQLISENDLTVMATQARYLMAYEFAGTTWERIGFWDKEKQLGPIVEQATHVCDLSRFFAPAPILDSVQVQTIEHTDPTGKLSKLTIDEETRVPANNRIPRLTNAMWRYENGACGTLLHGTVLHEGEFSVELAVIADGWLLRLVDPYNLSPKLFVRRPGHLEEEIKLGEDDCYYSEISTMVDVIEGRQERSAILSTFEDAVQSYELTWAIRWKGEENYRARSIREVA